MGRLEEAEWKADCLAARMDALIRSDAQARTGINNPNKPHVYNGMNAVQRLAKAQSDEYNRQIKMGKSPKEANEAAKAIKLDSDGPCWAGYEQRGTKEKDGKTVPNCVKADDQGELAAA